MLSIETAQNVWMQLQIMYLVENPSLRHKDEGEDEDEDNDKQLQRRMMSYQSQEFRELISHNWNMAAKVIEQVRNKVCIPMSEEVLDATLLRVAISQPGRNHFVEQLVKRMTQHDLEEKKYESGKTALHIAASIPNMVAAKLLVDRNSNLPNVPDHDGLLPLVYAVRLPSREMVLFLWKFTANHAMVTYCSELFIDLVKGELYDEDEDEDEDENEDDNKQLQRRVMSYQPQEFRDLISDNWNKAAEVIEQVPNEVRIPMSEEVPDATLLRVAISKPGRNHIVKQLVKRMTRRDLEEKKYESGKTALHIAASIPNMVAATLLVDRYPNLPNVPDHDGLLPLVYAVRLPSREMVLFLWQVTANDAMETYRSELYIDLVKGELYDFALYCISGLPRCDVHVPYLRLMAGTSSSFRSGISLNFWRKIIYSSVPTKSESIEAGGQKISLKQKRNSMIWDFVEIFVPQIKYIRERETIHEQAFKIVQYLCTKIEREDLRRYLWILGPTLFIAAYGGTYEIVEEILVAIPSLATSYNAKHQTIFQYAIVWRQERVFNLLYQMKPRWQFLREVDTSRNNSLHLAGYLGPQQLLRLRTCAPGAALQMQRELQWFKEVEKFSEPRARNMRNDDGMTPAEVFTDSHQELVKEGERWMKNTSGSCTIVAALIATVLFAASITLPGRNNYNGQPLFFKRKAFIVFGISDALGLFSSLTSGLMFLSILTSRYAEDDFLYALPKRLIIGLVTLFVSTLSTMVAFGATLYLVFRHDKAWVLIPVVALASLPVTSFVALQFPLLVEIIKSTYGPGIFGKQSDRSICLFS